MSAPSETYTIQLVQIQSGKRLAIIPELNSAPDGVICHREARGMGYRATPQGKGLSPEITIVSVADAVHLAVGSSLIADKRGYETPTGSETVARYQRDSVGTWESHNVFAKKCGEYGLYKPEEGKITQKTLWQSDKPIVAMKSRNGNGVKGLTERPLEGDTTARLRAGERLSTKPNPMTCLDREQGGFSEEPCAGNLQARFCERIYSGLIISWRWL
ncbi:MAG: hypothetical protein AB1393_13310 [Candidatus Edwardsbacteria bacterium]